MPRCLQAVVIPYLAIAMFTCLVDSVEAQDFTTQTQSSDSALRVNALRLKTVAPPAAGQEDTISIEVDGVPFKIVRERRGDTVHARALGDFGPKETIINRCELDFAVARAEEPNLVSLGCWGGWPLGTAIETEAGIQEYLGGFRTGSSVSLTFNDDEAALYSDLASDNLFIGAALGFARMGFGGLVSSNDEPTGAGTDPAGAEKPGSTVNQFYQGGGNASIYIALPTFYFRNIVQPFEDSPPKLLRRGDVFVAIMLSGDVPDMGTSVEHSAFNGRLGLQGTLTQTTMTDVFSLYGYFDASGGWGNTEFFENLDVGVPSFGQLFGVAKIEGGVDINRLVRIGVSRGWSTMGANLPFRLSLKLLRSAS